MTGGSLKKRIVAVLLLVVCLGFTVVALLVTCGRPDARRPSIAAAAFFGLCTCIAIVQVREQFGIAAANRMAGAVRIEPGAILRMRRGRWMMIGAVVMATGVVMAWGGQDIDIMFVVCSIVVALSGLVLLVMVAAGWAADRWVAFEPLGLRMGSRRGQYVIHWTQIIGVSLGEMSHNPIVALQVRSPDEVAATADPPALASRLRRGFQSWSSWVGASIVIMPIHFGVDGAWLVRAIERYATDPRARLELKPRTPLDSPD